MSARGPTVWRSVVRSGGAMASAQLVIAAVAVVRVPLQVRGLGAVGFGALSTALSLLPWLQTLSTGARTAGQVIYSEAAAGGRSFDGHRARAMGRSLRPAAGALVLAGVLCMFLPVETVIGYDDPNHSFRTAVGVLLVLFGAALTGTPSLGALQADGQFWLVGAFMIVGTLLGLGMTVLAKILGAPMWVYACGAIIALSAPAWLARVHIAKAPGPGPAEQRLGSLLRHFRSLSWKNSAITLGAQVGVGFDLVIVATTVGVAAAGVYAVVARLVAFGALVSLALEPLLVRAGAHVRTRQAGGWSSLVRLAAVGVTLTVALAAANLTLGGKAVAVLSGHHLEASTSLLMAASIFIVFDAVRRGVFAFASNHAAARLWYPVSVGMGVLNVLLSVLLAWRLGVSGPMWASAVVAVLTAGLTVWLLWTRRHTLLMEASP